MTPIEAITAVGTDPVAGAARVDVSTATAQPATSGTNFGELLGKGLEHVEQKITHADQMVRSFALDDSMPVHQVTIALEEARIAVELAMQVRTRLVEAYREIMNTQL